jgi:uncharacterized membrane protein (DUF2068 family)
MKQRSGLPTGLRLIVAYKLGKAVLQGVAALALWLAVRAGFADTLAHAAVAFADHTVHPLLVRLARWLGMVITPRHLHIVALLLAGDALVSATEGWTLRRGYPWGRWLVLVTTGSLLPLELYEIIHRPRPARIIVLLINAAIVLYLLTLARRSRAHLRTSPAPLPQSPR